MGKDKRKHVVLYGIFLHEHQAARLYEAGGRPVSLARVENMRLHTFGGLYTSAFANMDEAFYGVVWRVNRSALRMLDTIEGVDHKNPRAGFYRPIRLVSCYNKRASAFVYYRNGAQKCAPAPHDNLARAEASCRMLGISPHRVLPFRLPSKGPSERRFYFAYGSNTESAQMLSRCPSAKLVTAKARLPHHKLEFASGFCNAAESLGNCMGGAVWELSRRDWLTLDRREGFYTCEKVWLRAFPEPAYTYKMRARHARATRAGVSQTYYDRVLRGYNEHGLDPTIVVRAAAGLVAKMPFCGHQPHAAHFLPRKRRGENWVQQYLPTYSPRDNGGW